MMKRKAFRLTALLLCLIMIGTLGACKGDTEQESKKPDPSGTEAGLENVQPSDESIPPASGTDAQSAESTDAGQSESNEQKDTVTTKDNANSNKVTTPPTKAQQDSQPKTVAEIVSYYNKAANKIKTDKPGYTKVHKTGMTPGTQPELKSLIGLKINIPQALLSSVIKDETTQIAKGANSNNAFPAAGFSWASKLTPNYVKSATCTKSGSSYQIKIHLKDETNPQIGKGGYGSCMSVVDKAGASEMIPFEIKSITMQYHGGYISATIDIASGRITLAELYAASKMENAEISLGIINADIDSKETFKNFKW